MGFSACYPKGWQIAQYKDPETEAMRVEFVSSAEASDPAAPRIAVQVATAPQGLSEAELLEDIAIEFMNRRSRTGQEIVPIAAITVDGRYAAQDNVEGAVGSPDNRIQMTVWMAGFPAHQGIWYITVSGPEESAEEIESIYQEFLSNFHLLPHP
jgi:hypothetical protein